jgi:hypothetical protein
LLIVVLIFAGWAYSSREDYKNNTDAKIQTAVAAAQQQESTVKDAQFAQESKSPLKTYNGPESYGSLVVNYPKTWSGYVDDTGTGSALVDGYFAPGVVPAISGQSSVFALRVQVLNQAYSQTLSTFSNQQKSAGLTITAYSLPKLPQVVGVEVSGAISGTADETMVVLPLRSETVEIYTEGTQYLSDFNQYVLPNFSFSP